MYGNLEVVIEENKKKQCMVILRWQLKKNKNKRCMVIKVVIKEIKANNGQ